MIRGAEAFRSDEGNIEDIELVRCQRAPRCQGTHARLYAFCRDPGRSSNCPGSRPGPHRERRKPKPMMHGMKKSDEAVRPVKAVNKGAHASAEPLEERASTKGNPERQSTRRTQCRESVPQAAARIREAAERNPKERLTALYHHITPDALRRAYYALKRGAAAGVDGVTWEMYGEGLDERLLDLHQRLHRGGAYRAPPVRRVEIPKTGRRDTTARNRRTGRQGRPEGGCGCDPDTDL